MKETAKKNPLSYEDLVDSVTNISRKYARNCSVDREDMEQEIWCKLYSLSEMPCDIALARTIMINTAIDVSRKSWNTSNKVSNYDFSENGDESSVSEGDKVIFCDDSDAHNEIGYDNAVSEDIIRNAISKLGDRERKFVVSKGYLSCGFEFLADDFSEIIKDLSDEAKESLLHGQKGDSDDTILKLIIGIKTGTNSGSIRSMKTKMSGIFKTILSDC